jgi:L-fucose isomerase-like protein
MTLARLSRVRGNYVMLIAEGGAISVDRAKLGETNDHIAHTFVRLNASAEDFVKHLRSNHIHGVYGSVSGVMKEACRRLEIEPFII